MATKKMPSNLFVTKLREALNRKDGYIMGAKGQNPKKWAVNSWWFTQYSGDRKKQALKWRENAQRVWDCNGMAEGIYEDYTGVNINTKARFNYSGWCDPKGSGKIPTKYRVPGAAVFIHDSSEGYITHVGYLDAPVDASNPAGDWYVIEARGVMYGVVRTKLNARGWNRWGWMTKYFDYEDASTEVKNETKQEVRNLKNGCEGEDVKELQKGLIRLGYDLGKWGADGDFGDATEEAVRAFQKDEKLTVDGIFGAKSRAALEARLARLETTVEAPKKVAIVGGNCYVRSTSNTNGKKLGVAHAGKKYDYAGETSDNGWNKIDFNGQVGWVSGKYSRLEG